MVTLPLPSALASVSAPMPLALRAALPLAMVKLVGSISQVPLAPEAALVVMTALSAMTGCAARLLSSARPTCLAASMMASARPACRRDFRNSRLSVQAHAKPPPPPSGAEASIASRRWRASSSGEQRAMGDVLTWGALIAAADAKRIALEARARLAALDVSFDLPRTHRRRVRVAGRAA